jgi:hypothetical protein
MHQRILVQQAWRAAGLYENPAPELQAFLQKLDDPKQCWPNMIDLCRRTCASHKLELARALLAADKSLRLNLIRAMNPEYNDEIQLLLDFIRGSDPRNDEAELRAIAIRNISTLSGAIRAKEGISPQLTELVAGQH